jgi:hypothetical protein
MVPTGEMLLTIFFYETAELQVFERKFGWNVPCMVLHKMCVLIFWISYNHHCRTKVHMGYCENYF